MGAFGIFALIVLLTLVATLLGAVVWLAMLPGKISAQRRHPQTEAIRIAGWLGILTGIVWILALIWAYTRAGAGRPLDDGIMQQLEDLEERLALIEGRDVGPEGGTS